MSDAAKAAADLARAQLAQVRVNTCGHGVSLTRGRCQECQTTDPEHVEQEEQL